MPKSAGKKFLYILLFLLILVAAGAGGFALWLSHHYKRLLVQQMPGMVQQATDSLYHISFKDIDVSPFDHTITIKGLKLSPDDKQAKALRARHRKIPPTLSTISVPLLEASGFVWADIMTTRSLACKSIVVHDLKWLLVCTPHPEDSLFTKDKKKDPMLQRITAAGVNFINPDITYHYQGKKDSFFFFVNGGNVRLDEFVFNTDHDEDTSVFLYARGGKIRFNNLAVLKRTERYTTKHPLIDFETSPNSVTLKNVSVKNMVHRSVQTGAEKEIYNLSFPAVKLTGLNWHKLLTNTLHATAVDASSPDIDIRFFDKNSTSANRMGKYPHQLLLQLGIETNLEKINLHKTHLKYTEVTEKDEEAIIEFSGISGSLTNVTNSKDVIAKKKTCVIKLSGKFMNKSEVSCTFNFNLTDTLGRFTMDGNVKNMDGDDVMKQAQAFTFVAVTSFHLNDMDMHITGDETYAKGDFTVLYQDLKISLLKFKSKHRKGKKGPLSFLGSTLILYPSNPIKDKDVRTVSTSFARDPEKGFINVLWKNIFRAAKKTAVRNEKFIEVTDGKESVKGEDPNKKGILKRLFGRKDK